MSSAERLSLGVAVVFLAAALHGLGAADIVGDDEAREAGLVQEIVAGHWLLPRFNGQVMPDKPLLYHWLAAVPCGLAGFSETAVRLPSALAGAATVAWTARFGTDLFGAEAGLASAIALATMPAFFDRMRMARPDVLLVLLVSVSLGAVFFWWREGAPARAAAALACLGAATLTKGPTAPAIFALAVVPFLVWQRSAGRLRRLCTPLGLVAFTLLGLGWYAVALAGWGRPFVAQHLIGRYAGNVVGGFGAAGYVPHSRSLLSHLTFHPLALLVSGLPWTPLVALAWPGLVRDPRHRFLVCWALAPVVAFMPAAVRLRYYVLPSLPAVALLAGPPLVRLWRRGGATRAGLAAIAIGVVAWSFVGVPSRERALARTESLAPFARAVAARWPTTARLAFYGPPVSPVVVYMGRHAEPLWWRRERVVLGLGVIAIEPAYRELAAAGLVGEPLLSGEGRTGNRRHARIFFAQAR